MNNIKNNFYIFTNNHSTPGPFPNASCGADLVIYGAYEYKNSAFNMIKTWPNVMSPVINSIKASINVLMACLFTGLIVFINEPYNQFIWYKIFDVRAHLIDALASWGLCGIWLGWWMGRK